MMKLKGLLAGYGHRAVIEADAELATGAVTVLIGANGSGKSTLLRTITGGQKALKGHVEIAGLDVATMRPTERARLISLVLTDRIGGGGLRVDELVAIGRHSYSGFFGRLSKEDQAAVSEAIDAVGLSAKKKEFVASLSDGERQKAMIARALAQDTPTIVLDEPTSFLDVASRSDIMSLLGRLAANHHKSILLSTHDIAPAMAVADYVWAVLPGEGHNHLAANTASSIISSGALDGIFPGMKFDISAMDFRKC